MTLSVDILDIPPYYSKLYKFTTIMYLKMIHSKIILTVYQYFKLWLVTASNSALALKAGYMVFQAPHPLIS